MCNVFEWLPLRRNHFPDRKRQKDLVQIYTKTHFIQIRS